MQNSIRRAIEALTIGHDAERQFDLAAERIQHALLDIDVPTIPHLDIGVHAEPARLVGGDYIDLYAAHLPFVFGMGDASGKSLAAALNALMLRFLLRGLILAVGTDDLAAIVAHANTVVTGEMEAGQFITFLLGAMDPTTGALRVVNAGHEPPLVLRVQSLEVEVLERHGIVLGVQRQAKYFEERCDLERGDIVVTYTDGLTEATNQRGELFTIERLKETLIANRTQPAQAIADAIFACVKAYSISELRDDATILILRRT